MILCFILAIATLALTSLVVFKLIKQKKKLDAIVFTIAISCYVQMLILTIGLASMKGLSASSILQVIGATSKAMGGEANTSFIDEFDCGNNIFNHIYCVFLYGLWFVSPIAAGGVLISTLNRINSLFSRKTIRKKVLYIFTQLTPETLITARTKFESIPTAKGKREIQFIFLSGNAELLKNEHLPATVSQSDSASLQSIKVDSSRVENIEVWDFCFDGNIMTSDILGFTNTITTENPQIHLILNIFDTDAVSEKRYKTLIEEHSENKNLEVYLSDTQKSSVHSILRNYPLYNNLKPDSNKINILVVGMGEFGYKFIGNMFGSCHFLNKNGKPVKLCVTAIDKQADIQRDRMLMDSPGFISTLESEGHLSIFNCDAETSAFRRLLDETEDFDYCIISTENDETNIRIAKFLKRYFIRKIIHNNTMPQNNDELFHMIPPLVVKIRDGKKSEFVFAGREDDMLIPFGSIETTYDYNRLSTNDITGFAIRLYAINCNSDEKMLTESYDELTAKFDKHVNKDKLPSKYDIDSTNEEAICLRYLIHGCTHPDREIMLRYIADPTCKDSVTDSGYYFREENSDELEALVCLLHERWRYYTLYSGFSCPSAEDYKVYEEYNKKLGLSSVHKFVPAFYNNLLKPAEELQKKSPCDYIKIKLMTYITKP